MWSFSEVVLWKEFISHQAYQSLQFCFLHVREKKKFKHMENFNYPSRFGWKWKQLFNQSSVYWFRMKAFITFFFFVNLVVISDNCFLHCHKSGAINSPRASIAVWDNGRFYKSLTLYIMGVLLCFKLILLCTCILNSSKVLKGKGN